MTESTFATKIDITKLLISREEIDEDDDDFKCILKDLLKMPVNSVDFDTHNLIDNTKKVDINKDFKNINSSYSRLKPCELQQQSKIKCSLHQTYHDVPKVSSESLNSLPNTTRKRKQGEELFPVKLFKILERSEISGNSSIISWLPHGRAFKVHNEELFKKHIMRKYFFQTEFKSFKNQLYVYGFSKIGKRFADSGAYYHELFIRGRLDLCSSMTINRTTSVLSSPILCEMPKLSTECNKYSCPNKVSTNIEDFDEPRRIHYRNSNV